MTARIIVACGSGVATSQTVASKVERLLKADNVDATIEAVDIKSIKHTIKQADIYISIVKEDTDWGIPVFNGVAFLTGIGQDAEYKKLLAAIDEVNSRPKA
ncbi:PTS sugar transporter subunit IIB [Olsenella sp. Marseille-QA0557]|uniref:PTS sugar transporter subunit IIB n=1 Tax=Candidatus Coprovicinus avistercoris TaxID=2840754 RepID=A0A9D1L529_9ACTN|nr:PTS sugar transporter subunit IIB [Candidatus Coprovicinus avistercoris]